MPSSDSLIASLDLATLTGACVVALGLKVAGLFSNNDSFCKELIAACRKTGERVWRLPLHDDFKEQLKSSVADLKNIGGKWGGAVTAAKFLEQFVGSTPWIHLDIAGPSWCDTENATRDSGGTGCFVRSLVGLYGAIEPVRSELSLMSGLPPYRSGRCPGAPGIETAFDPPAVDVEREQDVVDLIHGDLVLESPLDDVEILAAVLEDAR